jgi:hypothetical protein
MNKTMQRIVLLTLSMVSACVAEVSPPPDEEPAPSVPMAAPSVPTAAPRQRDGGPFSRTVREQLATRGIHVHDGSKPAQGERTTVEQKWIAQFHPMQLVQENNPTLAPNQYAVQLTLRVPLAIKRGNRFYFDDTEPGIEDHCSGTLVGNTAVLTAAHCYTQYVPVGVDPATRTVIRDRVKMYSIDASPRRNGSDMPFGTYPVAKSWFDFANWPGTDPVGYPMAHDYAVLRLKRPVNPSIPVASRRVVASPTGQTIDTAHYPFQQERGFRMYYSIGDIGDPMPSQANAYRHNASSETESSGSGIFLAGNDRVAGINISEVTIPSLSSRRVPGQVVGSGSIAGSHPNTLLMLTAATDANIGQWIAAPLP